MIRDQKENHVHHDPDPRLSREKVDPFRYERGTRVRLAYRGGISRGTVVDHRAIPPTRLRRPWDEVGVLVEWDESPNPNFEPAYLSLEHATDVRRIKD